MANNVVFSDIESLREVWPVAAEVASGTPLVNNGKAGVALTASGGSTKSVTSGPYTISGIPAGGVGLDALEVSVATTGTFEFTGVVSSGTTPVPTSTAQGTPVFITSAGALTLASSGNTAFGRVNYPKGYNKVAGKLPVKIGA